MTFYAVKLKPPIGLYASVPYDGVTKWTQDRQRAIRADTQTRATIYALHFLELAPDSFTIEALEG